MVTHWATRLVQSAFQKRGKDRYILSSPGQALFGGFFMTLTKLVFTKKRQKATDLGAFSVSGLMLVAASK